jgi:phosphate transport system protein
MDNNMKIDQHTSRRYNAELESLRSLVLTMGGMVEQQCREALQALVTGDAVLAEKVASADHEVNDMEVDISARCTDILARRQPAASDLRMIVSIIRMVANLERIGDEAAKIARMARKLSDDRNRKAHANEPLHLGEGVAEMLRGALDAFARLDVEAAIGIIARDLEMDLEFKSLTRLLVTYMMEEPQHVKLMLKVNSCARALERIGDHAVNICEEVIYLVKGSDVRHLSVEEIRRQHLA